MQMPRAICCFPVSRESAARGGQIVNLLSEFLDFADSPVRDILAFNLLPFL
jgi:hypothetical protein